MSIKINFLSEYLDYFPDNYVDYSEEQGACCDQDILTMEDRTYQANITINVLDYYYWSQKKG